METNLESSIVRYFVGHFTGAFPSRTRSTLRSLRREILYFDRQIQFVLFFHIKDKSARTAWKWPLSSRHKCKQSTNFLIIFSFRSRTASLRTRPLAPVRPFRPKIRNSFTYKVFQISGDYSIVLMARFLYINRTRRMCSSEIYFYRDEMRCCAAIRPEFKSTNRAISSRFFAISSKAVPNIIFVRVSTLLENF